MEFIGIWLSPLLLLPGAGLLIMSTSQRFNRVHDEVHHILEERTSDSKMIMSHLLQRAAYFRNALVLLYLSVSIFAAAGLLGGITSGWDEVSAILTIGLTITGILCVTSSSIILIIESRLSLKIVQMHAEELDEE
ncbi:MAG: DUF2721 domain-containing protein [Ignavibacterium sp.]|nr:MAG: DUF2721 domain-containing protein [Ignavibacterium sp.]